VYLSPLFRGRFATPSNSGALRSVLAASGVPVEEGPLSAVLAGTPLDPDRAHAFDAIAAALARHAATGHPGDMERALRLVRECRFDARILLDTEDGLPYLVLEGPSSRLVAPFARSTGGIAADPTDRQAVRLDGRIALLAPDPS
jgi:hypothetical protein